MMGQNNPFVFAVCMHAVFPLTWISDSIKLYSRNNKIVVWMWKALERLFLRCLT